MVLSAHGLSIDLPPGWEGRIFRHPGGEPTLHAGDFPLPHSDGDFGSRTTAEMPPGSTLLVLTEYRPGQGLVPGQGLFAGAEIPLPLDVRRFSSRGLLVERPGQAGFQHFFTSQGRPFCLYVVTSGPAASRAATGAAARRQAERASAVLSTLAITGR